MLKKNVSKVVRKSHFKRKQFEMYFKSPDRFWAQQTE